MKNVKNKVNTAGRYDAFNLASLLTAYPDDFFVSELKEFMGQPELAEFCSEKTPDSWKVLTVLLNNIISGIKSPEDIRSDYIDLFDRGRSANSVYETEYGKERVMAKTNELADLAGFYNAFGLSNDSAELNPEMQDHIAVELEFYAYLFRKQVFLEQNEMTEGVEIVLDGRKKFLDCHLGRFARSVSLRPGVLENEYFSAVFNWVYSLVDNECNELGITPVIVEWLSSQAEPEAVDCSMANCGLSGRKD